MVDSSGEWSRRQLGAHLSQARPSHLQSVRTVPNTFRNFTCENFVRVSSKYRIWYAGRVGACCWARAGLGPHNCYRDGLPLRSTTPSPETQRRTGRDSCPCLSSFPGHAFPRGGELSPKSSGSGAKNLRESLVNPFSSRPSLCKDLQLADLPGSVNVGTE